MKSLGIIFLVLLAAAVALADSTINADNKYAYGANVGWINARGDITNGAVIGDFKCWGYMYGANIGWINLGNGLPTNGIRYSNTAANDFGVNHDGNGNLSGYAWGANIGWIRFETKYGKPKVALYTGNLSGYAWGANIGWISLSNAVANGFVRTDSFGEGPDTNGNNIPDDWEKDRAGNLSTLTLTGDYDNDGVLDPDEYRANTDPMNRDSFLGITALARSGNATTSEVTWASTPTRLYYVEKNTAMTNGAGWTDSGLGIEIPDPGATTVRAFADPAVPKRFFRVRAVRPPAP